MMTVIRFGKGVKLIKVGHGLIASLCCTWWQHLLLESWVDLSNKPVVLISANHHEDIITYLLRAIVRNHIVEKHLMVLVSDILFVLGLHKYQHLLAASWQCVWSMDVPLKVLDEAFVFSMSI
jgi:hypothetical protein